MLLEQLENIENRFKEVELQLSSPHVTGDMKKFTSLNREYKNLKDIVEKYHVYKNMVSNLENARNVVANEKDEEFRDMAKIESDELAEKVDKMETEIRFMLVPKDPEDDKNAIFEIRGGTG